MLHAAGNCFPFSFLQIFYISFPFFFSQLTVSWNIELHKIFKVLYVRRQASNFIVTQAQFSQAMQSEEILQEREREREWVTQV